MSESELKKKEAMYKNHAFEEYVSELVSLNRSLPDFRGQWCRNQYDGKIGNIGCQVFKSFYIFGHKINITYSMKSQCV
jgi:hypothetical protein